MEGNQSFHFEPRRRVLYIQVLTSLAKSGHLHAWRIRIRVTIGGQGAVLYVSPHSQKATAEAIP